MVVGRIPGEESVAEQTQGVEGAVGRIQGGEWVAGQILKEEGGAELILGVQEETDAVIEFRKLAEKGRDGRRIKSMPEMGIIRLLIFLIS